MALLLQPILYTELIIIIIIIIMNSRNILQSYIPGGGSCLPRVEVTRRHPARVCLGFKLPPTHSFYLFWVLHDKHVNLSSLQLVYGLFGKHCIWEVWWSTGEVTLDDRFESDTSLED